MVSAKFMGGPLDGKLIDLPEPMAEVRVPISPNAPARFLEGDEELEMTRDYDRYDKHAVVHLSGGPRYIYRYGGISSR